ncbi:TolB family protein [Polyangium aurulentum]|uniref:TolB family protein n=1 Tax=Polyangium aurulentum TaxID=2567896 RepID=UPI0010ADB64F|nr:PD40 domain-containing protein [Polyangium aurulentum]UQA60976.1 PD40 domain-containing protein [Polyangium aurulentum]
MTSAPDSPELLLPKRRVWPVLVVLAAIVLGAGIAFYRISREPLPQRVLIAIDLDGYWWEGSRPAAALADGLADRLADIGFEPVRGGDPEVTEVLEKAKSPEEAARKLRAGFIVTASLRPQLIEHPVEGGYIETRVDAPIEVRYLDDVEGSQGRLVAWSGAKEKGDALRLLANSLANMAFDEVYPRLTGHSTIQAIFGGRDLKRSAQLQPAKNYLEFRNRKLEEAKKSYEDLEKTRKEADRGAKVTYHSPVSAQDALGGAGASGVLVKTADVTPYVAVRTMELAWITRLETLEWRAPAGDKKLLWSGYHVFSYPSIAPEGAPVIFVEDLFGWAKTLTVVGADGQSKRIRVDPEHRFVDPKIAPGGKAAALYDRPCRECPANLLVVSTDDGRALFERPHEGGSFSGFSWIDATHLAFLYTPAIPAVQAEAEGAEETEPVAASAIKMPPQSLFVVDLGAQPPAAAAVHTARENQAFQSPEASRDGRLIAMESHGNGAPQLALLDVADKKLAIFDLGGPRTPAFSPDGKTLAVVRNGDIALFDPEKKEIRPLTDNPWLERYPVFSPDGARVYFESLGEDPNYPRRGNSLVASASVADAGKPEPVAEVKP